MSDARGDSPSRTQGDVLADRYELLGLLGVGGMGCVYRARDRELDEPVALKMLRRDLVSDPTMLVRFRQEVKLARRVTHANVARMFDIGEHEGEKFLTMELVEGESLGALLHRERRISIPRLVEIGEAVCAGLTAAHAVGVVHRDLKPDNVLLATDGRIVISDFGIARAFDPSAIQKTSGKPLGTPAYMAPEQVLGNADIDARADIYALGAMLFELVTGVLPWDGESAYAVAAQRLVVPPPDPRTKKADIPDAVARVILRCMARSPDDRYASAAEVAQALNGLTLPASAASLPVAAGSDRSMVAAPRSSSGTTEGNLSLAVLPFRNGATPGDDYIVDGLTEDLIDTLSMSKTMRVRSRGAVTRFRGTDRDPCEVGKELGVQVVVEGSVRKNGDELRISVRLISVSDGFQLWAKRFDCAVGEVLSVADQAAHAIAEALTLALQVPTRDMPTDPVAVDLYLRARHAYHKSWSESTRAAEVLFREALLRAPNDPTISSALAMALARRLSSDPDADNLVDEALLYAERALAVAPHLGTPRIALAMVRLSLGERVVAAEHARRAVTETPGIPDSHDIYGRMLIDAGRPEEGIHRLLTAMNLDPTIHQSRYEIARTYELLGDSARCDAIFASPPEDEMLLSLYWVSRWRVMIWRRDVAGATLALADLGKLPTGVRMPAGLMLGMIVDHVIPAVGLRELDTRAVKGRSKRRRSFFRQQKAECMAYVGDEAGCLLAVEEVAEAESFDINWLDRCPLLAPYRQSSRFLAVREVMAARGAEVITTLTSPPRQR